MRLSRTAKIWTAATIAAGGLTLSLAAAAATDAAKEVRTAVQHAGYASGAKTTALVHLHLHHVINCLVGSNGEGFDAKAGNPCNGEGNGLVNDVKSPGEEAMLDQSVRLAKIGVEIGDHRSAQAVALATRDLLQVAERGITAKHK